MPVLVRNGLVSSDPLTHLHGRQCATMVNHRRWQFQARDQSPTGTGAAYCFNGPTLLRVMTAMQCIYMARRYAACVKYTASAFIYPAAEQATICRRGTKTVSTVDVGHKCLLPIHRHRQHLVMRPEGTFSCTRHRARTHYFISNMWRHLSLSPVRFIYQERSCKPCHGSKTSDRWFHVLVALLRDAFNVARAPRTGGDFLVDNILTVSRPMGTASIAILAGQAKQWRI